MFLGLLNILWFVSLLSGVLHAEVGIPTEDLPNESMKPSNSWENINFQRRLEIANTYTSETFNIVAVNIASEPVNQYFIPIPEDVFSTISMFNAGLKGRTTLLSTLVMPFAFETPQGDKVYYAIVEFPESIQPGEEIELIARLFYTKTGVPYPKQISMGDEQQLTVFTNRYPLSPYHSREAAFYVIGDQQMEELNPPEDDTLKGEASEVQGGWKQLLFGPWADVQPWTVSPVTVIYPHNLPIVDVKTLKRDIWVSHWASTLQVEEYYELMNNAAQLKDGFKRLDYYQQMQKNFFRGGPYIGTLSIPLPENSTDHYFTDKVGMVSTFRYGDNRLVLKPRFPIFGGWHYNFTIGWTLPLRQYLHSTEPSKSALDPEISADADTYILAVPMLDGPVDTIYDKAEISFILPEGIHLLDVSAPLQHVNASITPKFSYFDLQDGHVKVTFEFKNLISELGKGEIILKYQYSKTAFYRKPLSIAAYAFIALMGLFVFKSINLSV